MSGENYIKRLERENAEKDVQIEAIKTWRNLFYAHLGSDKFSKDPTIQVRDVCNWLDNLGDNL